MQQQADPIVSPEERFFTCPSHNASGTISPFLGATTSRPHRVTRRTILHLHISTCTANTLLDAKQSPGKRPPLTIILLALLAPVGRSSPPLCQETQQHQASSVHAFPQVAATSKSCCVLWKNGPPGWHILSNSTICTPLVRYCC